MSQTIVVQPANQTDYFSITELLSGQKLPIEDISRDLRHFFVAKENEKIIGTIGMEQYGEFGLLRSMATDEQHRNKGIASDLIDTLFRHAKQMGITSMFLLTETAESYFAKKGFEKIERETAPGAVKKSAEFSHVCPASAVLMKKEIL
jgi:amino-acid N-acetyltransferase